MDADRDVRAASGSQNKMIKQANREGIVEAIAILAALGTSARMSAFTFRVPSSVPLIT